MHRSKKQLKLNPNPTEQTAICIQKQSITQTTRTNLFLLYQVTAAQKNKKPIPSYRHVHKKQTTKKDHLEEYIPQDASKSSVCRKHLIIPSLDCVANLRFHYATLRSIKFKYVKDLFFICPNIERVVGKETFLCRFVGV